MMKNFLNFIYASYLLTIGAALVCMIIDNYKTIESGWWALIFLFAAACITGWLLLVLKISNKTNTIQK